MLPTFVIGLREGLEAVLIVSIIATFLRRNGAPLRPLWVGVVAAVGLSFAVGVVLSVIEHALPERGQEGMETVIGAIAVFFVTGMVLWMRKHARSMKRELEHSAQQALGTGTTYALVLMVFLSILREGFETSVFLLATFQSASSATAAAIGAVLGIVAAIGLGYAIFAGGVRINLSRFFSVTGVFLILVAAGLVVSALHTGHEAGWVTIGQARTVDLSWLAPHGSVQAALVSGVLGIPADPRVIEVLGWLCYLVPISVVTFWPARWRPSDERLPLVRGVLAGVLALVAVVLLATVSRPSVAVSPTARLDDGGRATVRIDGDRAVLTVRHDDDVRRATLRRDRGDQGLGVLWTGTPDPARGLPVTLDLDALLGYTAGRVPVGLNAAQSPGPYDATWRDRSVLTVRTYDGGLVSASQDGRVLLTLTGGGLQSTRVVPVAKGALGVSWRVADGTVAQTEARIRTARGEAADRTLWKFWFPGGLLLGAAWLAASAARGRRSTVAPAPPSTVATEGAPHDRSTSVPAP